MSVLPKKIKSAFGFTLIELIIYITVIGIIAAGIVTYSIDLTTTSQKARVKIEVQQSARFAMERMLQELRASNGVNVGSSTFGSSPGVLSINVETPADSPTVFDVNSGLLRITQGAGSAEPLIADHLEVTNLVFENRSNSSRTQNIKIALTVAHPNPTNSDIYNASFTVNGSVVIRQGSNP